MSRTFDVAVIGLGAAGSAAARHCALRGLRVAGFDRYAPPHTYGSSHGGSRIIRRAYFEGQIYVPILERAYELWHDLEEESGIQLVHHVGALTAAPTESPVFRGAAETAKRHHIPHEELDSAEVAARFPAFTLREDERAIWEPQAGWIDPEAAIRAQLEHAAEFGAELHFEEAVREWEAADGPVRIRTGRGVYEAGRLIVCAGGWTRSLLANIDLPLRVERQVNVWYRPWRRAANFLPDRCPVYIWEYDADAVLYGFPDLGGGVKAGLHHRGELVTHPDDLDRAVSEEDVQQLSQRLKRLLPDACGDVSSTALCFYTNTPDERYLIDRHPAHHSILFASACSGHGFKASIAVGEILAALSCDEAPAVDFSAFRLIRGNRNHEATAA